MFPNTHNYKVQMNAIIYVSLCTYVNKMKLQLLRTGRFCILLDIANLLSKMTVSIHFHRQLYIGVRFPCTLANTWHNQSNAKTDDITPIVFVFTSLITSDIRQLFVFVTIFLSFENPLPDLHFSYLFIKEIYLFWIQVCF